MKRTLVSQQEITPQTWNITRREATEQIQDSVEREATRLGMEIESLVISDTLETRFLEDGTAVQVVVLRATATCEHTTPTEKAIIDVVAMINTGKANPKDVYPPNRYHGD